MKLQKTTGLIVAATLFVGVSSALTVLCCAAVPTGRAAAGLQPGFTSIALSFMPLMLACLVAFLQYRCVMESWQKALGELTGSLNLDESGKAEPKAEPQSQTIATRTCANKDQYVLLRKSIEETRSQFEETRKREKELIQHAVDVICVLDLTGRLLSVNPAASTVWGYSPEELIGRQITDFLAGEDVDGAMKSAIARSEQSIDRIFFENRFRKKSGEMVDLLWSAHLSAKSQGLFCIAHDITDRKRAERLLQESEERIRRILESLPAGVAVIERKGRIDFVNKMALELTGYSSMDIQNLSARDLFSFFKDGELALHSATLTQGPAVSQGEIPGTGFDCQIARSSGERFPAEVSVCQLAWGESTACLVVFLDATAKYEVEQTKRQFVAMVSHDLRTPLTAINLIFDYLIDGLGGELSKGGREMAGKGQESCQRLITLVKDLLDLEKMQAGKFVLDIVETSLPEVISAAVAAVKPYAESQGVSLSISCAPEKCFCDGGRIIQVLTNLLGNAIRFSEPEGNVLVEAKGNQSWVTVSVSNRGRMIPADKLKSIFEKFEQAGERDEKERRGTGLGLAISRTLVEQHGGNIWVESSKEKGTRFSFTLPEITQAGDTTSKR
jgi:PAS domain S-box-containing protein